MSKSRAILVSGMVAGDPGQGGATWAVLQYVLGLRRLGHDVCLVEPVRLPAGQTLEGSASAAYFDEVVDQFGLRGRAGLLRHDGDETYGMTLDALLAVARRADLLINISGMLTDARFLAPIPVRVYLDLDPVFIQLWHATQGIDMRLAPHTHFVTVGQAIGEPGCAIPDCGVKWIKTFPPVVLEEWPVADRIEYNALTTVANWRGYGSIEYQGTLYGQKAHSLRPLISLPALAPEKFLLALSIHPDETMDLAALEANGWGRLDPVAVAGTPVRYRAFIQGSKAEFGIAKSGYVAAQSGWFSDRSACYLASGRPVIAQETGFSRFLPVGEGLFAFKNAADVLKSIETMNAEYPRHARRAREIAAEYFDSDRVLSRLLGAVGL